MTNAEISKNWCAAVDEYVRQMREDHGENAATTREAEERANEIMQAAIETVALCKRYGGDPEGAFVWTIEEGRHERDLRAWCLNVAVMEAGG